MIRKQKLEHETRLRNIVFKAASQRLKKNKTLILELHKDVRKAEQYKTWENMGHLLTSNFTLIRKGMDSISLNDPSDPDAPPVTIPLNPDLPPQENISQLFVKSKKLKQSVEKIRKRIQDIQIEIESLQSIRLQLEMLPYPPSDRIEKIYQDFLKHRWIAVETIKTRQHKKILTGDELFKSFILEGRWKVWVGQNDQKNDQLTFGYAGKDDYWFHARGVPGSHILLRKEHRKDNPPKSVLEAAAAIAAFFSKAKTSALVPVIMTQKKYVRKMKQGKPGQVIVERETVLMVEPSNPESR
jgi:predicted ribosome quality control (RQC) complex YloA/Tae2 family protein